VLTLDRITKTFAGCISLILSFHGTDLSSIRSLPPEDLARWRDLLSHVDGVVVCSNDLGKKVVEVFNHEVLVHVVHNGLDAATFVSMADATTATNGRTILNVAKFEQKKGQDVLIQAFAAIAKDYSDLKLILVGATDKTLRALRELCVSKGIEERVLFFPDTPHHQVPGFFRRATIFALPSRQEPFGIVLLEAGAFGLPVVASRVGGITEILADGLTGRLVAPDNSVELAHCLRSLLDSPASAQEMGARLQQHVSVNFTWIAAHDKYVALVQGRSRESAQAIG
jgi:glycosyltransferase involved in cell wall biosynthesis